MLWYGEKYKKREVLKRKRGAASSHVPRKSLFFRTHAQMCSIPACSNNMQHSYENKQKPWQIRLDRDNLQRWKNIIEFPKAWTLIIQRSQIYQVSFISWHCSAQVVHGCWWFFLLPDFVLMEDNWMKWLKDILKAVFFIWQLKVKFEKNHNISLRKGH